MTCLTLNLADLRRSGVSLTYLLDEDIQGPWYWMAKLQDTSWVPIQQYEHAMGVRRALYEAFHKNDALEVTSLLERYIMLLKRFGALIPQGISKDNDDSKVIANIATGIVREKATCAYNKALSYAFQAVSHQWKLKATTCELFEVATNLMDSLLTSKDLPSPAERVELTPEYIRVLALSFYSASLERKHFVLAAGREYSSALAADFHKISYLNSSILDVLAFLSNEDLPTKELWVSFVTVKMNIYEGIALYCLGLEPGTTKGDSRRRKAAHCFDNALKELVRVKPGERLTTEQEINYFADLVVNNPKCAPAVLSNIAPRDWIEGKNAAEAEQQASGSLPLAVHTEVAHDDYWHQLGSETPSVGITVCAHIAARLTLDLKEAIVAVPIECVGSDGVTSADPTMTSLRFEATGVTELRSMELRATDSLNTRVTHVIWSANPVVKWTRVIAQHKIYEITTSNQKEDTVEVELTKRLQPDETVTIQFCVDASVEKLVIPFIKCFGVPMSLTVPRSIGRLQASTTSNKPLGLSIIFILDAMGEIDFSLMTKKAVIQETVCLIMRSLGLGPNDTVGVVAYDPEAGVSVPAMYAITEEGVKAFCEQIMAIKSTSTGTPLARAIEVATQTMAMQAKQRSFSSQEIILFSDGSEATTFNRMNDWLDWSKFKASYERDHKRLPYKVHTFAMGPLTDRYLLEAVANATGGDYSSAEASADGVSAARLWFVRHISNAQQKVATNVTATLLLQEGVTLIPEIYRNLRKQNEKVVESRVQDFLELPDFSEENQSNQLWHVSVPRNLITHDYTRIGTLKVSYTDSLTGQKRETTTTITVHHTDTAISRDIHAWCKQLYVDELTGYGAQMVAAGSGESYSLRGGEVIQPRDAIVTSKASRLRIVTSATTTLIVESDTSFVADELDKITLDFGTLYVRTGQNSKMTVHCLGKNVIITGGSFVMLTVSQGVVNINCALGKAMIGKTQILKMSQTLFKSVGDPNAAWTLPDEDYYKWLSVDEEISRFITTIANEKYHSCRNLIGNAGRIAVQLLTRNRKVRHSEHHYKRINRSVALAYVVPTLKMSTANTTCFPRTENSILLSFVDRLESILEDECKRTSLSVLTVVQHLGKCLFTERPCGVGDLFTTAYQMKQLQRLADAKAKADLEHQYRLQRAASSSAHMEQRRREDMVLGLIPLLDFESMGSSTPHQVELLLRSVMQTDLVQNLLKVWGAQRFEQGPLTCVSFQEMTKLFMECTQQLDPMSFNVLMELLGDHVHTMIDVIEKSKLSRACHAVFRHIDFHNKGYVTIDVIEHFFSQANNTTSDITKDMFRDFWKRFEAMSAAIKDLLAKADTANSPRSPRGKQPLVPVAKFSPSSTLIVAVDKFVYGTEKFLSSGISPTTEGKSHKFLEEVVKATRMRLDQRANVQQFVSRQRKETERNHLVTNDMRHVFDGLTRKDLKELLHAPTTAAPMAARCAWSTATPQATVITDEILNLVASPVVTLLGLKPMKDQSAWSLLKELLTADMEGFFTTLRTFPVLSIRYSMVLKIGKSMGHPQFIPNHLGGMSRILSALCEWVRLMTRIAYLEHDWDDPVPSPYVPPEATVRNPRERYQKPSKTVSSTVLPVSCRPHSAFTVNATFLSVFESAKTAHIGCQSPYPPQDPAVIVDPLASHKSGKRRPSGPRRFTGLTAMAQSLQNRGRPSTAAVPVTHASRDESFDARIGASTSSPVMAAVEDDSVQSSLVDN